MDRFYPIGPAGKSIKSFLCVQYLTWAGAMLEDFAKTSKEKMRARAALNIQHMANDQVLHILPMWSVTHYIETQIDELIVRENGFANRTWVLCTPDTEDATADEVILRVQGALVKNDLVPRNVQT
jgi:hypothetical protein